MEVASQWFLQNTKTNYHCSICSHVSIWTNEPVQTPRNSTTKCSLMQKIVISSRVMMRSWTGLVFPRTAPNEIRTVAVLKSALIILQRRKYGTDLFYLFFTHGHIKLSTTEHLAFNYFDRWWNNNQLCHVSHPKSSHNQKVEFTYRCWLLFFPHAYARCSGGEDPTASQRQPATCWCPHCWSHISLGRSSGNQSQWRSSRVHPETLDTWIKSLWERAVSAHLKPEISHSRTTFSSTLVWTGEQWKEALLCYISE